MPELTKAQINQLLNCQDNMKAGLQGLAIATKKMNQATNKIQKENAGLATTSRGSAYYKKIHNSQAAKDATAAIEKIVQKYEEDVRRIEANIKIFDSQKKYQKNMQNLVGYYKSNINSDKAKIQEIESNKAIANRMSRYYHKKDDNALWYRKYLHSAYWIVVVILVIIILFGLYSGGYIKQTYLASTAAYQLTRDHFKRKPSVVGKNKMSGGADYYSDETRLGRQSQWRNDIASGAKSAKKNSAAGLGTSISILILLLVIPFIVKPIITALKPVLFPYA